MTADVLVLNGTRKPVCLTLHLTPSILSALPCSGNDDDILLSSNNRYVKGGVENEL